jgi:hypothetical protein
VHSLHGWREAKIVKLYHPDRIQNRVVAADNTVEDNVADCVYKVDRRRPSVPIPTKEITHDEKTQRLNKISPVDNITTSAISEHHRYLKSSSRETSIFFQKLPLI